MMKIQNKIIHATNNPINNNPSNGKKTIVVDAGHNYGGDGGAVSKIDGVTYSETDLNMQVASKLKTELENRGYNVVMTRNESERETLAIELQVLIKE